MSVSSLDVEWNRDEPRAVAQHEISEWIGNYLSRVAGVERTELDATMSLSSLGLDSVEAQLLLSDLESWLGRSIDAMSLLRVETLGELTEYLARGNPPAKAKPSGDERSEPSHFERVVNRTLGRRLRYLGLDKHFVRGEGSWLYDASGRAYLDFVAAFGALPFGHSPRNIWQAVHQVYEQREPVFVQPAALGAAGELAERLLAMAPFGLARVTFANSGAEAVEAAIKLVRAATGKQGIVSTVNSFHGKTLAALSATRKPVYQEGFGAPAPNFHAVPFGDIDALERLLAEQAGRLAAFLIEPIQGEGGMRPPPPGYLAAAKAACERAGILFIADEIQTGLGRTGTLFACSAENVRPDVLLLAKALGGGVVPIAALLANERAVSSHFELRHSSTFAGNTLACRVGLAVLDELSRDDGALIRDVARNGAHLFDGLLALQRRFPEVVAEVRGRGYMLGLELRGEETNRHTLLDVAARQGQYAALVSSYLLNVHGLRVAPTLVGSNVLRIEPPLTATRDECSLALQSLEETLEVLSQRHAGLIAKGIFTGNKPKEREIEAPVPDSPRVEPGDARRFAFVLHPLDIPSFRHFDSTLTLLDERELERLGTAVGEIFSPFVGARAFLRSLTGEVIRGDFIVVPHTAEALCSMSENEATAQVAAALQLAKNSGASLVGLGGYTSVVTRGGNTVAEGTLPLTTGNAYTAVAGVESVRLVLAERGATPRSLVVAVVGAAGAVGRGVAMLLANEASRLILVGNPARSEQSAAERLQHVVVDTCRQVLSEAEAGASFRRGTVSETIDSLRAKQGGHPPCLERMVEELVECGKIACTQDLSNALQEADVVVIATNSPRAFVEPEFLKANAIVCDLSRPMNVSARVGAERPDVLVIDGGLIQAPSELDLRVFGLERNHLYACMAETMLLALEGWQGHFALGADFAPESILKTRAWARKHGFRIAPLRSFGNLVTNAKKQG